MRVNNLYFSKFIKKSLKSHARPFSRRKFGIHARDPLAVPYSVPIHFPFFGKTTINKRIYSIRNTRVGSFRWPLWSPHPKRCFHPFIQVHCGAYLTLKMQLKFMSEEYNLVPSMMIFWILMIFHDFCIKMRYFADFFPRQRRTRKRTSVYISSVISFESKCHFSILKKRYGPNEY